MDQICKLYFELQNKVAEKTGFTPVVCILESEKLFLGISESRTPMFLIDCKFKSVVADLKLECISVLFNKVCKLIGDDNEEYLKTEVHIIDFDENIYGNHIVVYFSDYLREEKEFESVDALIKQLNTDVLCVKGGNYEAREKKADT